MSNIASTLRVRGEELARLTQMARVSSWKEALSDAYEVDSPLVHQAAAAACLTSWMPLLPAAPQGKVLNIDGSLGAVTEGLAYRYPWVLHMSLVPEHLPFSQTRLRQEGLSNVDYLQGNPLRLPVGDEGVDLVVAILLFQWVHRYASGAEGRFTQLESKVCREIFRVLKPGGAALVGVQRRPHSWGPLWGPPRSFITVQGHYRGLFRQMGFEKVTFYSPFPDLSLPRTIVASADRAALKSRVRERMSASRTLKEKARGGLAMLAASVGLLPGLFGHYLVMVRKEQAG